MAKKRRKGSAEPGEAAPPAGPPGRPLLELAALLGADAALLGEVDLAETDPDSYFQRFGERLAARGIGQGRGDLAWYALVDGLRDGNRLRELDWKSDAGEVRDALVAIAPAAKPALARGFARECDDTPFDDGRDPGYAHHCLRFADRRLRRRGLAIVELAIDGDSHPVAVVPAAGVERAVALARASGVGELVPIDEAAAPAAPSLPWLPPAPPKTPRLRLAHTVAIDAPWSSVRGFLALPEGRAVMLTSDGSDRRWSLWTLSAAGAERVPVDATTFPEWAGLPPDDRFCALFRAGPRFGLMSNGQFRLWERPGDATTAALGKVTPPLFRGPDQRPLNISFGGASDDAGYVVATYFAFGSLTTTSFVARLVFTADGSELRHDWLREGLPVMPALQPPETDAAAGNPETSLTGPLTGLTAVAYVNGWTSVAATRPRVFATLGNEGPASVVVAPFPGELRPTSCGRYLIVVEETPSGARQSLRGLADGIPTFPLNAAALPANVRLLDCDGTTWWARDVEGEGTRLHLGEAAR